MPRGVDPFDHARMQGRLWTPGALGTGLRCWFDFTDLAGAAFTGGDFESLRDGRLLGNLITTGAPARPALGFHPETSRPLAVFSGQSRMWSSANVPLTAPFAAAWAFRANAATGNFGRVFSYATNGGDDRATLSLVFCERAGAGATTVRLSQANTSYVTAAYAFDGSTLLIGLTVSALGTPIFFRNGAFAAFGTLIPNSSWTTGTFQISAAGPNNQPAGAELDGGVLAAIVYSGDDFAFQRPRLEGYIAWRAGLRELLDPSHPFRNAPPLIGG